MKYSTEMEYFIETIKRCSKSGILLDTNLLLLYFMGLYDKKQIGKFKRTRIFTDEDFDTLLLILQNFNKFLTTPHILTEVSNLAGQLTDKLKYGYFETFAKKIQTFDERYFPSKTIVQQPAFLKFGLTDIAISLIIQEKCLVLTIDIHLYLYLQKKNIEVINFNHIRFSTLNS